MNFQLPLFIMTTSTTKTRFHTGHLLKKDLITHAHNPDEVIVHTQLDVEPILDHVKERREVEADLRLAGRNGNRNMIPVAEIPMHVYERAFREGWHDDPAAWRRFLSDPDNQALRITTGRLF